MNKLFNTIARNIKSRDVHVTKKDQRKAIVIVERFLFTSDIVCKLREKGKIPSDYYVGTEEEAKEIARKFIETGEKQKPQGFYS